MHKFLSIDIGTSSIKAALFSGNQQLVFFGIVELPQESIDTPSDWLEAFASVINHIRKDISPPTTEILYISISGHGPSTVFIDKHDKPIHYISWQHDPSPPIQNEESYYIPQVLYVRKTLKHIYNATETVIPPAEFLVYKLTGTKFVFIPHYDYLPCIWTENTFLIHKLPNKIFPMPIVSGFPIDYATTPFAKSLGLEHAIVVSGGLDYMSALLGAGSIYPRKILQRSGTSTILNACMTKQRLTQTSIKNDNQYLGFITPGFYKDCVNVGYTVPHYDTLFKITKKYFPIDKMNRREVITRINKNNIVITPITNALNDYISIPSHTSQDLISKINNSTQENIRGDVCLSLLLHQFQDTANKIFSLFPQHSSEDFEIAVSGGHASNIRLMQLQSKSLGVKIHTFNPFYTEMQGNLFFALHAQNKTPYLNLTSKITHHNKFTPKS